VLSDATAKLLRDEAESMVPTSILNRFASLLAGGLTHNDRASFVGWCPQPSAVGPVPYQPGFLINLRPKGVWRLETGLNKVMGRNLIHWVRETCGHRQADSGKNKPGSETVNNPDPDSFRPQNQRSRTQNPEQTGPQPPLLKEVGASKPTAAHPSGGPVAGGAIGTSGMPLTAPGRERPPHSDACKHVPRSWVS